MLHSDMLIVRHSVHPLVEQAYIDSQRFHEGQVRKYTGAPYWTHTREVAEILIRCGIEDPEMLAAAHLHDTVEDTDADPRYILQKYGARVHSLVVDLTYVPTEGNRGVRMTRESIRLGSVQPDAKTIKCADMISNTSDIVAHDPGFAKVYVAEKANVLFYIRAQADPVVAAWADRSLSQAQAALQ